MTRPIDTEVNAQIHKQKQEKMFATLQEAAMQTIKSGSQTVASIAERTTAANTHNTKKLTQKIHLSNDGVDLNDQTFDVALPQINSPNSSQKMMQLNEACETFRNSHFLKRGCRKLVEQANKQKEYEFSATEKKNKLHQRLTMEGTRPTRQNTEMMSST